MNENWVGHMLETEEGALSCLVNVALADACPDASRPVCTTIRIPFHDPGEDGFGSTEERDALSEFEDAIDAAATKGGGVFFASVRGAGVLDLWFYSTQKGAGAIMEAAKKACAGYEIEGGSQEDAEWEQYKMLFPPPESMAEFDDFQLIHVLEEQGDTLEQERPVDHALYFATEEATELASKAAVLEGYQETDRDEDGDGDLPFLLQVTKRHAVTPEAVAEARAFLTALAEEHGGTYDGWQTPVVKK